MATESPTHQSKSAGSGKQVRAVYQILTCNGEKESKVKRRDRLDTAPLFDILPAVAAEQLFS